MRVLRFTPYVFISNRRAYRKNSTGFGRSVWDITKFSTLYDKEIYLFTFQPCREINSEGINFISYNFIKIIRYFNIKDFFDSIKILRKYGKDIFYKNFLTKLKFIIKYGSKGYLKSVINLIQPDVIHIHGITLDTLSFLDASLESNFPVVVALHGLYSIGPDVSTWFNKRFERETIEFLNKNNIYITVISSAIKDEIQKNFNITHPEKIIPVINGVKYQEFNINISKNEIRGKYNLDINKKIMLTVGNLIKSKDNLTILKSLPKLPVKILENLIYLIVGEGPEKENLLKFIYNNHLERNAKLLGYKEGRELIEIYNLSDIFILTSSLIGFSRMFLEAFASGIPAIGVGDVEGLRDIYSPICMELVKSRSAEDLSSGIIKALQRNWDRNEIKEYAKNFGWEKVTKKYREVYEKAILSFDSVQGINNYYNLSYYLLQTTKDL